MLFRQAVDGHAPRDARKISLFVAHIAPSSIPVELQESLLHHVLGIMGVAQHGIRHAKDKAGLPLHTGRELHLIPLRQVGSTLPFTRKDGREAQPVQIFFKVVLALLLSIP
jgi:hypothetical protein